MIDAYTSYLTAWCRKSRRTVFVCAEPVPYCLVSDFDIGGEALCDSCIFLSLRHTRKNSAIVAIMELPILANCSLWGMGIQRGENVWPWLSEEPSLVLSLLISIPFLYGMSSLVKLRKGDHLARWRKDYSSLKKMTPFILPVEKESIRSSTLDLALVIVCSVLTRIVNVLTPMVLRRIIDRLASTSDAGRPIAEIIAYVLLQQVLRESLTSLFWVRLIRVEADIGNRLSCHLYDKLLSLSADFHEARQVSEMYGAVASGGPRFARFAMSILFSKVLALIDMLVALVAFWRIFGLQLAASV